MKRFVPTIILAAVVAFCAAIAQVENLPSGLNPDGSDPMTGNLNMGSHSVTGDAAIVDLGSGELKNHQGTVWFRFTDEPRFYGNVNMGGTYGLYDMASQAASASNQFAATTEYVMDTAATEGWGGGTGGATHFWSMHQTNSQSFLQSTQTEVDWDAGSDDDGLFTGNVATLPVGWFYNSVSIGMKDIGNQTSFYMFLYRNGVMHRRYDRDDCIYSTATIRRQFEGGFLFYNDNATNAWNVKMSSSDNAPLTENSSSSNSTFWTGCKIGD